MQERRLIDTRRPPAAPTSYRVQHRRLLMLCVLAGLGAIAEMLIRS